MFAYCNDNPVNFVDYSGTDAITIGGWGVFGVAAAGASLAAAAPFVGALAVIGVGIYDLVNKYNEYMSSQVHTDSEPDEAEDTDSSKVSEKTSSKAGESKTKEKNKGEIKEKNPTSPNQMQKQVESNQAPKGVESVHKGHVGDAKPHIHFKDGTALNIDGSISHKVKGIPNITNEILKWIVDNGWNPPIL